jgi:HAD superfamily phosphatase (TIGR01668 family)
MRIAPYLGFVFAPKADLATRRIRSVFDLDPAELKREGIRVLLLDIDDTFAGHKDAIPTESVSWLKNAAKELAIGLVSNCGERRRKETFEALGGAVSAINSGPDKPGPEAFTEVLQALGVRPEQAAMVGDRLSMDLYGAKLAGIPTRILVEPFSAAHGGLPAPWAYRALRRLENGRG